MRPHKDGCLGRPPSCWFRALSAYAAHEFRSRIAGTEAVAGKDGTDRPAGLARNRALTNAKDPGHESDSRRWSLPRTAGRVVAESSSRRLSSLASGSSRRQLPCEEFSG